MLDGGKGQAQSAEAERTRAPAEHRRSPAPSSPASTTAPHRVADQRSQNAFGVDQDSQSSFHQDDRVLLGLPFEVLARHRGNWSAMFQTGYAHHPYVYPGKDKEAGDS